MWFSVFFFLILSLIVEVYLWWKLQASLIFLSGRTCTIGGWLNTFLPHCMYMYIYVCVCVCLCVCVVFHPSSQNIAVDSKAADCSFVDSDSLSCYRCVFCDILRSITAQSTDLQTARITAVLADPAENQFMWQNGPLPSPGSLHASVKLSSEHPSGSV